MTLSRTGVGSSLDRVDAPSVVEALNESYRLGISWRGGPQRVLRSKIAETCSADDAVFWDPSSSLGTSTKSVVTSSSFALLQS